jgi:hypothetical protein
MTEAGKAKIWHAIGRKALEAQINCFHARSVPQYFRKLPTFGTPGPLIIRIKSVFDVAPVISLDLSGVRGIG